MDTRQLALRIIRAKGLTESDKVLAQSIALRVVQTRRMRARRNKVERITKPRVFACGDCLPRRGGQLTAKRFFSLLTGRPNGVLAPRLTL